MGLDYMILDFTEESILSTEMCIVPHGCGRGRMTQKSDTTCCLSRLQLLVDQNK